MQQTQKNHKVKYFISVGIMMFISLATYQVVKSNYINNDKDEFLIDESNEKDKFGSIKNLTSKQLQQSNHVNIDSALVNDKLKEKAESLGEKVVNIKQEDLTAKKISYKMMREKQYFLSLVSHAEGYLPNIHRDNSGYALGMGWNLSKQSKEFNASVAQALYLPKNQIEQISKISKKNHGQINEKAYSGITLLPHRAIQASFLIGNYIEENVVKKVLISFLVKNKNINEEKATLKVEQILDALKDHERDTLTYHAYKVGPGGFAQYEGLMSNLVKYSEKPTLKNKLAVASEMTYKYRDKGKLKEDVRAREIVAAMFIDPSVFAETMKVDKPKKYMENEIPANINHNFVKTKLFVNEGNIVKTKNEKIIVKAIKSNKEKIKAKNKTKNLKT